MIETPSNANGTYTTGKQVVEYVYRRKKAGHITVDIINRWDWKNNCDNGNDRGDK